MSLVDTHAHLDQEDFDADRDEVIRRAENVGLEAIVCPGVTAATSEACLRLARSHPLIYAAVGIDPNSAAEAAADDWACIVALAAEPRVVAVGETGLDRHWDFTPFALQQEYFDRHLRLSAATGLPVIVHCREAEADLVPMLRAAAARSPLRGVLHAMSGDADFAAECVALGLHISFAGNLTHSNKRFETLRAAARTIPEDRLLVETDSPYLVPQAFRGRQRRNEPAWVVQTAALLAELRGVPLDRLAAATTANARRLFRLSPPA